MTDTTLLATWIGIVASLITALSVLVKTWNDKRQSDAAMRKADVDNQRAMGEIKLQIDGSLVQRVAHSEERQTVVEDRYNKMADLVESLVKDKTEILNKLAQKENESYQDKIKIARLLNELEETKARVGAVAKVATENQAELSKHATQISSLVASTGELKRATSALSKLTTPAE